MINIEAVIYDSDETSVSVQLILHETTGSGIDWVHVVDRVGALVAHIEIPDCPREYTVDLGRIETVRLPLSASSFDCAEAETPARVILVAHPSATPAEYPETVAPCISVRHIDNPACSGANAEAQRLRNEIVRICSNLDFIRDRVYRYRSAAAAFLLAGLAALAIAAVVSSIPFVGGILAALLMAAGLVLLVASVSYINLAYQEERRLAEEAARLEETRAQFTEAANQVMRACRCPGEITVDLTQPPCA